MTVIEKLRGMGRLLTPKEVSEILACHRDTVYDWIYSNRLSHIRVGSRLKLDSNAVADFVERRTV